jgi:RimJ/RimL family protein N-acetyltransferase
MTLVLNSPRLQLRDFVAEDWQDVHAYTSRPEASRFQSWEPDTPDEARAHIQSMITLANEQPRTGFHLAVVFPEKATVIGEAGLDIHSQRFRTAEISYTINPEYWGHGFATEVAATMLLFGFTTLNLHRIFATCDPRNIASERVLQKLGMRYEGQMRQTILIQDGWRDSVLYSLLEHEWQPEKPENPATHAKDPATHAEDPATHAENG